MIGQFGRRRGARCDRSRIVRGAPPHRNARLFMSTPTRFNSIARSIAAAETGSRPF